MSGFDWTLKHHHKQEVLLYTRHDFANARFFKTIIQKLVSALQSSTVKMNEYFIS